MIKWLLKWVCRLVLLLVLLAVILVLSLDSLVRSAVEQRIRTKTGLDARIGRLTVGLLSPEVTAENIRIFNSAEFGGTPFLDLPEVHLEYDRLALLRSKLHLTLLRINLAEVDIVKSDKGRTNVLTLKTTTRTKSHPAARFDFAGIDVLNLSIGKVRFIDLKNPGQTHERIFGIQNRVYADQNDRRPPGPSLPPLAPKRRRQFQRRRTRSSSFMARCVVVAIG
jgi:uncharacterized protein involved in outer membrane biogenesis